ncbi:hypothetical protein, partial [Accumulibacter sp.]|uniref:hypothetical protein n=1 Tax=Accumulibacter sp. TaxID=2053492 RepID=UPI002D1FA3E2
PHAARSDISRFLPAGGEGRPGMGRLGARRRWMIGVATGVATGVAIGAVRSAGRCARLRQP